MPTKKKPTVVRSLFTSRAKRQCFAAGRWFALSLTASAPPQMRARSMHFALGFFSLRTRAGSRMQTDLKIPRLGPSGASTSPESGFAVSTEEKILSREKRKMSLTFSYRVYL